MPTYPIKYITDKEGNRVLPKTSTNAVVDSNGDPIESIIDNVVTLGELQGSAVIPAEDLDVVALKKTAQVLTTAEKDQVAQNLNNRPATNGMARIELKATDNFKSVVEAQTGGNTVFVIKYDFTLTGDVTVPADCVLEFDGGSISGAYTLTLNNTLIEGLNCISYDSTLAGICKNTDIFVEWFIGTDLQKIQAAMDYANVAIVVDETTASTAFKIIYKRVVFGNSQQYVINAPIDLPNYADIEGNNALIKITTNNNIMQALHSEAYIANIRNLTFMGNDVCALYLNVGNLDSSMTTLYNLKFETNTYTSGKFAVYLYNISSQCVIERCTVRNSSNFLKVRCDSLIIRDCWINKWGTNTTQDTPSIEFSEGCRYTRIENCQFIPDVSANNDYRWIDLKGGRISIANCIFGGESAGIPIIWKYTNAGSISIYDSQISCGATSNKAGIIVLMNNVMPGSIQLKNTIQEYGRLINPYGYVKDSVENYNDTALQNAFNLFVDKMIEKSHVPDIDISDANWFNDYQKVYCLSFAIPASGGVIINNPQTTNPYTIAKVNVDNTEGSVMGFSAILNVKVTGTDNGYPYIAIFRFRLVVTKYYDVPTQTINLIDKHSFGGTHEDDGILPYIDVTMNNLNMSLSKTGTGISINEVLYSFEDKVYMSKPWDHGRLIYIMPQKCNELIR